MAEVAFLQSEGYDPPSGRVSELRILVEYGPNKAHLRIVPEQPTAGDTTPTIMAEHLQQLGEALLRIVKTPSAIYAHPRHRKRGNIP
jgi:hypothetical protein